MKTIRENNPIQKVLNNGSKSDLQNFVFSALK